MKLYQLAKLIRSKNAGPFMLTLDILFADDESYHKAAACEQLSAEHVAQLYGIAPERMRRYLVPKARAIKFSFPRVHPSGDFLDTDLYGCQQHRPLVELELPD
ncbi:MAG TPA: DUF4387 domain-containing protein [Clostridiales bacterium]|nr:DUF4387 domain-containing protein [Clostridiales bacterium]